MWRNCNYPPRPMCHRPRPVCCPTGPVCEAPKVNVVNKYHCTTVPHIIPCHTHVVNHQINKHVYVPKYTCSEETVCHNEYAGKC